MYPVKNPIMTLDYGVKRSYYYKKYHTGVDLVSSTNDDDIFVIRSGYIIKAEASGTPEGASPSDWGNFIIFRPDGNSYDIIYAHLSEIYVKEGLYVNKGQKIAKMGFTGSVIPHDSRGKHLHFEIRTVPWEKCNDVNPHFMLNE